MDSTFIVALIGGFGFFVLYIWMFLHELRHKDTPEYKKFIEEELKRNKHWNERGHKAYYWRYFTDVFLKIPPRQKRKTPPAPDDILKYHDEEQVSNREDLSGL